MVHRTPLARICALALTLFTACATPAEDTRPPLQEPFRVLLLGDSISMGYTPHVQELLAGRAHVVRPTRPNREGQPRPENCEGTNKGVVELDRWLALDGGAWDVIHFNFGLHDLKRVDPETGRNSGDPDHPHQADPERYGRQLAQIVARLQATGARVVFANTTPVPEGIQRPYRAPQDARVYNDVARGVMEQAGVPINDLFAFAAEAGLGRPADVHFSAEGSRALAERVVEAILERAGLGQS